MNHFIVGEPNLLLMFLSFDFDNNSVDYNLVALNKVLWLGFFLLFLERSASTEHSWILLYGKKCTGGGKAKQVEPIFRLHHVFLTNLNLVKTTPYFGHFKIYIIKKCLMPVHEYTCNHFAKYLSIFTKQLVLCFQNTPWFKV